MVCKEVIAGIESEYPREYALEWDNVGLLAGRSQKEVRHIYLALDATDEVVAAAIAAGADLLVTHHPLIFAPLRQITDTGLVERRILTLIQHDIAYYAMHTNYDVLRMGKLAGSILGLQETEVLEVTKTEPQAEGIGQVGLLPEAVGLKAYCEQIKAALELDTVKVFGDLSKTVQKVAVSPGSGKSVIQSAIEKGADVLITGDIDHHTGIDAAACNLAIIDAGHYGTEHIFIADMAAFLTGRFPDMQITAAAAAQPFEVL